MLHEIEIKKDKKNMDQNLSAADNPSRQWKHSDPRMCGVRAKTVTPLAMRNTTAILLLSSHCSLNLHQNTRLSGIFSLTVLDVSEVLS